MGLLQELPQHVEWDTEQQDANLTAFPNPAANELQIAYQLEAMSDVDIYLTDVLGQRVQTLLQATQDQGTQQLRASLEVGAGTYFLVLNINGSMETMPIIKR